MNCVWKLTLFHDRINQNKHKSNDERIAYISSIFGWYILFPNPIDGDLNGYCSGRLTFTSHLPYKNNLKNMININSLKLKSESRLNRSLNRLGIPVRPSAPTLFLYLPLNTDYPGAQRRQPGSPWYRPHWWAWPDTATWAVASHLSLFACWSGPSRLTSLALGVPRLKARISKRAPVSSQRCYRTKSVCYCSWKAGS